MARVLGLDVGDRRIGLALSDSGGILASPLTIIEHTTELAGYRSHSEDCQRARSRTDYCRFTALDEW